MKSNIKAASHPTGNKRPPNPGRKQGEGASLLPPVGGVEV